MYDEKRDAIFITGLAVRPDSLGIEIIKTNKAGSTLFRVETGLRGWLSMLW